MAKIDIDGEIYEVDERNNLLQECLSVALDLPYFCWHPSMGSVGSCRQCAVIEYANDEDERGRLVMSCMTPPRDGARYSIKNAAKFRANAIESIMTSHPHDCPVCEEGGECHLQDMTVMSGHNYRRFDGKKITHTNQNLGPFINHEMNRCITCYRCVRFYKDYAGGTDLSAQASHNHTYFGRFQEGPLESEFSGNLAEVCPTGVFTDKPYSKHYSRKWDLQSSPAICSGCAVGCNINPGERYGTLRRVVNRFNDEVNGYFICDKGRFGAEFVNSDKRIRTSMTRTSAQAQPVLASTEEARQALQSMVTAISGGIGIGSPRASMEANFALRELVGENNFYAGVTELELQMFKQVLNIYQHKPVNVPNLHALEGSDAVLILGEDLTNTAARVALALRQSVKNLGKEMAAKMRLPAWQDAAIRQLAMDQKSPLYILSPHATRLDDIAQQVHISSALQSAKIGNAIAHAIDVSAPVIEGLSQTEQNLVSKVSAALMSAKQPLVVSGTGSLCIELITAAANIATALSSNDSKTNLSLIVPEVNSLGLSMMMGESNNSISAAFNSKAKTAIVLENDLYRRAADTEVDRFIAGLEQLAVLDSLQNKTGEQANLVLAAATFAEASGTYINYEARAQHSYAVFKPEASIQASTAWLSNKSLNELTQDCSDNISHCAPMAHLTPGPDYNVAGLKAPRQQIRYSGRTAMRADISVHEPKQEQDENGVMNYSMEGVPLVKDASVIGSPWVPGWNSNQSIVKFQQGAGGALKQASPGICLINSTGSDKSWFDFSEKDNSATGFNIFPLYHIFGSEELSAYTPAIQEKATAAYVALNPNDVEQLGLQASDGVQLDNSEVVPYIIRESIKVGSVGVSVGLSGLNFHNLAPQIDLRKSKEFKCPANWRAGNIIVSDAGSNDFEFVVEGGV